MRDPHPWSFIKGNYAGNMTMGVSRQIDVNPEAISILTLLEDLLSNVGMLTKEWFLSNYASASREPTFKLLFGNHDSINDDTLKEDVKNLREKG